MSKLAAFSSVTPLISSRSHQAQRDPLLRKYQQKRHQQQQEHGRAFIIVHACACKDSGSSAAVRVLREEITRLAGEERGIFGLETESRDAICRSISLLETETRSVLTCNLQRAVGTWRLLYTTQTILGRKRARLAIASRSRAGFVRLGAITQRVWTEEGDDSKEDLWMGHAENCVHLNMLTGGTGMFTVNAAFKEAADVKNRVEVSMTDVQLTPQKLKDILGENAKLLTEIFNPTGWLDVCYVDEQLRVGRDHKGDVFVMERIEDEDNENLSEMSGVAHSKATENQRRSDVVA